MTGVPKIFYSYTGGDRLRCARWRGSAGTSRAKPTLVLLHEGLGCIEMWKRFPGYLAKTTSLDVLTYDRPGYGGSNRRNEPLSVHYNEEEALERLPRLLRHNGVEVPILVGHSAGGSIALLYAAHHPTSACITLGAHAFVEDRTLTGIREADEHFRYGGFRRRLDRYHGEQTESVFRGWADVWLSPAFRNWSIEWALPHVHCPVLAMHGKDDRYGSTAHATRIARGCAGPAKTVLLSECGHMPHLEQSQTTMDTIVQFLHDALPHSA